MILCEKDSLIPGITLKPSHSYFERAEKLLRSYDDSLFPVWNSVYQRWEIWEHGLSGKDYPVMLIKDGREIDFRDIADIDNRHTQKNIQKNIFLEDMIDSQNEDREMEEEFNLERENWNVSMEIFNQVCKYPVITGGY